MAAAIGGLLVLAVVGIAWYFTLGPARGGGQPRSVVAHFSGSGDLKTDSFVVRKGWQIEWKTDGEKFAFAVKGDVDMGTVVDQATAGSGITSPVPSGMFSLEVTAKGPWEITILQGD